jgi:hypothetical protein
MMVKIDSTYLLNLMWPGGRKHGVCYTITSKARPQRSVATYSDIIVTVAIDDNIIINVATQLSALQRMTTKVLA